MFTEKFLKDAGERAVKTAAQAVLLTFGMDVGFNVLTMDLELAAGVALGGGLVSILTSLASTAVGSSDSASAVD